MSSVNSLVLVFLFLLITTGTALGQEPSQEELAKQSQYPVASLISVPFQNNTNFGIGPGDETQNVLNIQPVWPFRISDNWNAPSGNQWTVPLGGCFGKIFKIGKQPVNAQVQAFYNFEVPDNGPDWQLRLQFQLLFPT